MRNVNLEHGGDDDDDDEYEVGVNVECPRQYLHDLLSDVRIHPMIVIVLSAVVVVADEHYYYYYYCPNVVDDDDVIDEYCLIFY